MVVHYHAADPVVEGSILEIGRPWADRSRLDHLLACRPYPFGPAFENWHGPLFCVRFLWLVPITRSEANYARAVGVTALEDRLERSGVETLDPWRPAVA